MRAPASDLIPHLAGIDIVISALGPNAQLAQLNWVDAAKEAGVKRFVPCGFTTISPRGAMTIRDEKETVHDRIFFQHVPYTIVDVGYWHQISWPQLPSGRVDYAAVMPLTEIYGDGDAPTLLTDKRDQGRFMARIIKDPRTLNKRVVTHSDELTQNQIWDLAEKLSGESIPRNYVHPPHPGCPYLNANHPLQVSKAEVETRLAAAVSAQEANPEDWTKRAAVWGMQYIHSKFIRRDNTLENAAYLGYLDARVLYPDFKPRTFEQCLQETIGGKAPKLYGGKSFADILGGENAKRS